MIIRRFLLAASVGFIGACSGWEPVRSARDIDPEQQVKIEHEGRVYMFDSLIACDATGEIIATATWHCRDAEMRFSTRRDKVFVWENRNGLVAIGVTLGVLGGILVGVVVGVSAVAGQLP